MPYSNIASIPQALKTAGLTLTQANEWSRYFDGAKKDPSVTSAAAIAWSVFKKRYYKSGKTWKRKKLVKAESYKHTMFNPVLAYKIQVKEDGMKKEDVVKGYEFVYRGSKETTSLEDTEAEGKLYEKELIREGSWAHPQRPSLKLKITLSRLKKWVANFNKNLFKVPVPKRHTLDPEENRGWVKEIFIKKDENGKHLLMGKLDITNKGMQESIDNGDVQDVSVSVAPYIDNQGKKYGEALQHVALTLIPHIDSQSKFDPISAEGYMSLEQIDMAHDGQAPTGSDEELREEITKAIITARLFPEEKSFYIVGTYETKVIVQYYGGGTGGDGERVVDRYFEIPYTLDLKGSFVFGDKVELTKQYYFTPTEFIQEPTVAAAEKKDTKKIQEEVIEMEAIETLKAEYVTLEKAKADLETKVAEMEPKMVELEKAKTELEESNKSMKEKLDAIEAEKRAAFEKDTNGKVSKLIEEGHILPVEKDKVTAILLEGGEGASMLETVLSDRKAVDLSDKSKQKSTKPTKGGKLSEEQIEAEAKRIMGEEK